MNRMHTLSSECAAFQSIYVQQLDSDLPTPQNQVLELNKQHSSESFLHQISNNFFTNLMICESISHLWKKNGGMHTNWKFSTRQSFFGELHTFLSYCATHNNFLHLKLLTYTPWPISHLPHNTKGIWVISVKRWPWNINFVNLFIILFYFEQFHCLISSERSEVLSLCFVNNVFKV